MINLRFVDKTDYERVFEYSSDERVTKYLTWDCYQDSESFSRFFCKMLELTTIENMFLSIFDDNVFLGTAHIIRRKVDCYQFGFGIMPQYWGKQYGKTILRNIEELIKRFNPKIPYFLIGECHVNNKPIQNILISNGYFGTSICNNRVRYQKEFKGD